MVCQGSKYTVELVDAETKIPFKEHCAPDGRVFVEVEPDIDYLIMVDVDGQTKVIADFCVDGKCLGYDSVVFKTRRGKCYNGISSRKDDKLFENCLNFGKIFSFRKDTNIDQSVHSGGNVKVSFYDAIKDEKPDIEKSLSIFCFTCCKISLKRINILKKTIRNDQQTIVISALGSKHSSSNSFPWLS